MKSRMRAILTALAAAALISLLPWTSPLTAPARADAPAVLTRDATLYARPNTSSRRMFKLAKGQTLTLRTANSKWTKVVYLGKVGYIARKAIQKKESRTFYAARDGKLYAQNDASSAALCGVRAGDAVYVTDAQGEWCRVVYQGFTGFVPGDRLTGASNAASKPTPEPAPTVAPTVQPTPTPAPAEAYALRKLALYRRASNSSKIGVVPKGAKVMKHFYNNKNWARVTYGGKTGYLALKYLSDTPPEAASPAPKPTATPKPTPAPTATPAPYAELAPNDKGDAVKKLQTRLKSLNWFTGAIGGNYLTRTTQAVKDFQEAAGLGASGVATVETQVRLYSPDAPRYEKTGESTATPASGRVVAMDWWTSDIQNIFYKGRTVVVTDVRTGISWREARYGGTNHADVQPLTAKDTAALKAAYGGKWSWDRRPVWVSIGNARYAASMNGMPHGGGSITGNDFGGHHCIHFVNSRTHGSNRVDEAHQAAIREALAAQ